MRQISVFLDNEGPCTLNDNAFESVVAMAYGNGLSEEVGRRFYERISVIDDIWGDFHCVLKDPYYSAGHTLKVVLPFLRALGGTRQILEKFAQGTLRVVPGINEVLRALNQRFDVWQISTSYDFFVRAFCAAVGFPASRTRCTTVNGFDDVPISDTERLTLLRFIEEVAAMPLIAYEQETGVVIPEHQGYYDRITDFVWNTLYDMSVGVFLRTVHPVGQCQKRDAMNDICHGRIAVQYTLYVGDSQTDVGCVKYLQGQGLTMMFNGKGRVCHLSDLMYIGEHASAMREVAELFSRFGRDEIVRIYGTRKPVKRGGFIQAVTPENIAELHELSVQQRKNFRGQHIGALT